MLSSTYQYFGFRPICISSIVLILTQTQKIKKHHQYFNLQPIWTTVIFFLAVQILTLSCLVERLQKFVVRDAFGEGAVAESMGQRWAGVLPIILHTHRLTTTTKSYSKNYISIVREFAETAGCVTC